MDIYSLPTWARDLKYSGTCRVHWPELQFKVCPYCGNDRWNMEVNVLKCKFNCWVCENGGSVRKLLKLQGIKFDTEDLQVKSNRKVEASRALLPDNLRLTSKTGGAAQMARQALIRRGMSEALIEHWDIRLGTGKDRQELDFDYLGYVLVPFYGLKGLEYYMAVGYGPDTIKYKFPKASEADKDCFVPFSREASELLVVEGLFDGVTGWQYTPHDILILMGKKMLPRQLRTLKAANYLKVHVCLDGEALLDTAALCQQMYRAGIAVYMVKLPRDKDPNDLGAQLRDYVALSKKVTMTTFSRIRREIQHGRP